MSILNLFYSALCKGFSPIWWLRKFSKILINFPEYLKRRRSRKNESHEGYIRNIKSDGFTLIDIDYSETLEIVDYCRALSGRFDPADSLPTQNEGKDFWKLLVDNNNIEDHPMLIEFAKNPYFKDIASNYLDQEAVLSNVTLMKSYPTNRDYTHSQTWHLDADDTENLLFYLYINDVNSENGPFECIPKSVVNQIFTPRYFRKYSLNDGELGKYVKKFSPVSLTGFAGTMFACDTCTTYHRGSRCESSIRLALAFRYQTFSGLYPFRAI